MQGISYRGSVVGSGASLERNNNHGLGQCDATGEFGWGVAPQYMVRTAVNHLELNMVHPTLKIFFCQLSEITTLL